MTTSHRIALSLALVISFAGCDVAPEVPSTQSQSQALSEPVPPEGPWQLVSSDIKPATSYTISGDQIDVAFAGYYTWNGTWATGYKGYTFAQPVALVEGATYELTLTVSSMSNPIPAALKASLSGSGIEQAQTFFGNGSVQMTFTVSSAPGDAPTLDITAHPVLGHIGPLDGLGIVFQSYSINASLLRIS